MSFPPITAAQQDRVTGHLPSKGMLSLSAPKKEGLCRIGAEPTRLLERVGKEGSLGTEIGRFSGLQN